MALPELVIVPARPGTGVRAPSSSRCAPRLMAGRCCRCSPAWPLWSGSWVVSSHGCPLIIRIPDKTGNSGTRWSVGPGCSKSRYCAFEDVRVVCEKEAGGQLARMALGYPRLFFQTVPEYKHAGRAGRGYSCMQCRAQPPESCERSSPVGACKHFLAGTPISLGIAPTAGLRVSFPHCRGDRGP